MNKYSFLREKEKQHDRKVIHQMLEDIRGLDKEQIKHDWMSLGISWFTVVCAITFLILILR